MDHNRNRVNQKTKCPLKKLIISLSFLIQYLICSINYASNLGLLFNISSSGAPSSASITLCLNGKASLSCQDFTVSALNLSITTTIPNHVYPSVGIKINTPGFTLANLSNTCIPTNNGYCLFSVSDTSPKVISLLPPLGTNYGGGIVACLDGTPYMNLIAALNDSINGIPWGGFGIVTGAQSTMDGAGNSALIINAGVTNSAVNLCMGTINGYSDWFLPAKDQLNCLYTNQSLLPGLMNAVYWSSTESDENNAWFQFFDNGNQLSVFKTFYYSVRCVRSITAAPI